MSFRVLVIPEDPTYNGYILKPLVEAILKDAGRPNAVVRILTSPRVAGYDQALKVVKTQLRERYAHWDLWIFFPDADRASAEAMGQLEVELSEWGVTLLCCRATPEVEIYACAGYRDQLGATWEEVRTSRQIKKDHFEPLRKKVADTRSAGGGREALVKTALRRMQTLYQFCPELGELRERIKACLKLH